MKPSIRARVPRHLLSWRTSIGLGLHALAGRLAWPEVAQGANNDLVFARLFLTPKDLTAIDVLMETWGKSRSAVVNAALTEAGRLNRCGPESAQMG